MYDVFCYGAISLDVSGRLEAPFREGGQAEAADYRLSVGGDAAIVAMTLSGLGRRVGLAGGPVGADPMGDYVLHTLAGAGVEMLAPAMGRTAVTAVVIGGGRRSTITFHDATPEELIPVPPEAAGAKYVYVDGCFGLNGARIAEMARARGVTTLLSLDLPSVPHMGLYDSVIAGESAAGHVSGDPVAAARAMHEACGGPAIVTLGERGSICCDGAVVGVPAFPVAAVDTTGAGAAFAAGFIHARLKGLDVGGCLEFASAAGALKAMARGSYRMFSESDVLGLIAAHGKK